MTPCANAKPETVHGMLVMSGDYDIPSTRFFVFRLPGV